MTPEEAKKKADRLAEAEKILGVSLNSEDSNQSPFGTNATTSFVDDDEENEETEVPAKKEATSESDDEELSSSNETQPNTPEKERSESTTERSNSEMEAYAARLQARLEQAEYERDEARKERERDRQQRTEPAQPKEERVPQYALTDVHLEDVNNQLSTQDKRVNMLMNQAAQQERAMARNAFETFKSRYPDAEKYLKEEHRNRAVDHLVKSSMDSPEAYRLGHDWMSEYDKAYKLAAFDDYRGKANELEKKREERKNTEKKDIHKIPHSGGAFQAPATNPAKKPGAAGREDYRGLRTEAHRLMGGE